VSGADPREAGADDEDVDVVVAHGDCGNVTVLNVPVQ
jgi:hypothetical protein